MSRAGHTWNRVKVAQALFYLNAVIWLVIGGASLIRLINDDSNQVMVFLVIAVMMFGNAGAMAFSGWGIGRTRKWWYVVAVLVLVVNIVLTFTDQFGLLDLITLIIDLVLLGLLWTMRSRYA